MVEEKKRKKEEDSKTEEQLKQKRKDKYELRTSMLKRVSKRRASKFKSAGDTTTTESNDESSRDVVMYEGSRPGQSRKRALVNSASIINSSNAVFERYFKMQESAAASRESVTNEELRLRKEELEIQRRRFKREDSTVGEVIELKKRLDKGEEVTRRRNQEQNSRFDRLEDLLVKLFKKEGGKQLG